MSTPESRKKSQHPIRHLPRLERPTWTLRVSVVGLSFSQLTPKRSALYISLFALRNPAHEDFKLGSWRIPKDKLMGVDSRVAAMDASFWNTCGTSIEDNEVGSRLLSHFWPKRFLEYPNDPYSGPLRFNAHKPSAKAGARLADLKDASTPQFTIEGLSGAWLPFGGGMR